MQPRCLDSTRLPLARARARTHVHTQPLKHWGVLCSITLLRLLGHKSHQSDIKRSKWRPTSCCGGVSVFSLWCSADTLLGAQTLHLKSHQFPRNEKKRSRGSIGSTGFRLLFFSLNESSDFPAVLTCFHFRMFKCHLCHLNEDNSSK